MFDNNLKIIRILKKEDIFRWQVAKKLGIHESVFSRWFREELNDSQVQQIMHAVGEIKAERNQEG